MTSTNERIHIAIPNQPAMLCDPLLNLDTLRVGYLKGLYEEQLSSIEIEPTPYGKSFQRVSKTKYITFGRQASPMPLSETKTIRELYEIEGNFTIKEMLIEFPYDEEVVSYGIPQTVTRIALHRFGKWNFSPSLMMKIFDRIPSELLYQNIKKARNDWAKRSGNVAAFKRFRSTWLVNRPSEMLPLNVYRMWYGRNALIVPERQGDFKGRELGLGRKM